MVIRKIWLMQCKNQSILVRYFDIPLYINASYRFEMKAFISNEVHTMHKTSIKICQKIVGYLAYEIHAVKVKLPLGTVEHHATPSRQWLHIVHITQVEMFRVQYFYGVWHMKSLHDLHIFLCALCRMQFYSWKQKGFQGRYYNDNVGRTFGL